MGMAPKLKLNDEPVFLRPVETLFPLEARVRPREKGMPLNCCGAGAAKAARIEENNMRAI
jgi:hypothetical protein